MDAPLAWITYKLANGKRISLEVSIEVKSLLEQADRQIRSQRRQDRRRHTEYVDGLTATQTIHPQEDFANLVIKKDSHRQLCAAIEKLSEPQRRRVQLYYFNDLTCRQIAEMEGISFKTVSRSLVRAVENLKAMIAS